MSNPIVSLQDVNLIFTTNHYRPWSWREVFVRAVNDPSTLSPNPNQRLHICKNINFAVHHGDRIALLGVNGVGKTSLLRCVAGYYLPTSGLIRRNGQIRALFDVGVGIQPDLTGRENAELLAELLYPGDYSVFDLIDEALEFSELGQFLDVPFRMYSKGMQARLGLSLAAMKPADLLILDEVFDGADAFFRGKIALRMRELMRKSGAVIFVSHTAEQIRDVCNRLLLLHQGQIVFDGPVADGLKLYEEMGPAIPRPSQSLDFFEF